MTSEMGYGDKKVLPYVMYNNNFMFLNLYNLAKEAGLVSCWKQAKEKKKLVYEWILSFIL